VDSTFAQAGDLARPWRRATLVAGSVAAAEFVLLVVVGVLVLVGPLAHRAARHTPAVARSSSVRTRAAASVRRHAGPAAVAVIPRNRVKIMVLNGNGRNGAAGKAAAALHRLGYRIAGTANASRMNYAASLILYRPGYRAEGLRLAHDLGVRIVGPLDGMRAGALRGGELAVILGA
jgi:LytR cell envelope-related transcriptional attenuator